ncbi:PE-PPE domain-containing protein [Mycolicibacterium sp. CR10]|uniref:PE-PPE domain-containing protein n=1 Tax=Mycolicibacterium sp. CR10 TaxID=2562314 RepID=UPI001F0F7714|nr:PE-PPE domain-containing protein [Mycolicibacterium sp. CR10]
MPCAVALSAAPPTVAATVLVAEGTAQQRGKAENAFGRAFCRQNTCRSISTGPLDAKTSSRQIQSAVDSTPGDIIVMGYSLGAAGVYDRMRQWETNPSQAPDPDRVVLIVTYGNPENKFGGQSRKNAGAGLPVVQPYPHLDVTAQYDSAADKPTRYGFYSTMNIAFSPRHFAYFEDEDINDPDNLVYTEGNTTYMLIKADVLPMLTWVKPFVSEKRLAELDARYRPLIEKDYDRPAYIPQGDGADWGNGNAPPSLTGAGAETQRLSAESISPTTTLASEEQSATSRSSTRKNSEQELGEIDNADEEDVREPSADDDTDSLSSDEPERDSEPVSGTASDTDSDTDSGSDESADAA